MPNWIENGIWILLTVWTVIEVLFFVVIQTTPRMRYSDYAKRQSMLWFVILVFWLCFQTWG